MVFLELGQSLPQDLAVWHGSQRQRGMLPTNNHNNYCGGTGTDSTVPTNTVHDNYRYSNGQRFRVYFALLVSYADIYTGQGNCERWPVDRPSGWNAGLIDPEPMCGGGRGEV